MITITYEEQQLMAIFNSAGTRQGLISALEEMHGQLTAEDAELKELTDSSLDKLRDMTDAEFDTLDLFPDFSEEDEDAG